MADDQKTHKNPALKSQGAPVRSGPKPFGAPPRPAAHAHAPAPVQTQPPVLELDGKKWKVVSCRFSLVLNQTLFDPGLVLIWT